MSNNLSLTISHRSKKLVLSLIRFYQRFPLFHARFFRALFLTDAVCRFRPTCSAYTYQAISKYGILKGSFLGLKRIVRCHPWSQGGHDPLK